MFECADCDRSLAYRHQMIAEAEQEDMYGVIYWQAVLRQACKDCQKNVT